MRTIAGRSSKYMYLSNKTSGLYNRGLEDPKLIIKAKERNQSPGNKKARNFLNAAYPTASIAVPVTKPKFRLMNIVFGPSMNILLITAGQ